MKPLALFLFCVILEFLACVSAENAVAENKGLLHHKTEIFQVMKDSELEIKTEVEFYLEEEVVNSFPAIQEYFFIKDNSGKVIIMDAKSYEKITTYNLPEIRYSMVAIVNDTFYYVDTVNGTIMSASVENIVSGPDAVNWTHVGSFPPETLAIHHGVAVNGSSVYFVTNTGVLYLYDATLKTVTKMGTVISNDFYASLVIVNHILYIHKDSRFYSFDGAAVKEIATPETRFHCGLFQLESFVCRVGGNSTDIGLNPDPVSCYDPGDETWTVISHINQYRHNPGITSTESGTYIFGGYAAGADKWLNLVEMFNPQTNIWSFIPSPLTNEPQYVQAVTFYF